MISTNDLRTGVTVELEGNLFIVLDFQHVKPGKGSPFVRTKLKNVRTGYVLEKTFNAGEKLNRAHIDRNEMQFLYAAGEEYVFMDTVTFEQHPLQRALLGEQMQYLKEGMTVFALSHEGEIFGVDFPNFVELAIVETEPGLRGDRAQAGTKPAKLETGAIVQVPLFVETGERIQVDTRTGEYLKRV